jgi:hypothetical protein
MDQFRGVLGKIESISYVVNLKGIKSSVSQSTFRIETASEDVIEVLGSNISKIGNAGMRRVVACDLLQVN